MTCLPAITPRPACVRRLRHQISAMTASLYCGFLSERETATARMLVESTLRLPQELTCTRPNNTLLPLRWTDPLIQLLLLSENRMGR
jgi:hypothetical protein